MKILIVEDEDPSKQRTERAIRRNSPGAEVAFASSRDAALDLVGSDEFDLIICDIRIPTSDGSLDIEEQHGLAVEAHARAQSPGTPVLFLTGFNTSQEILDRLSGGGVAEMYGQPAMPVVQYVLKDDREGIQLRLERVLRGLESIEARCHLELNGSIPPSEMLVRAILMYATRIDAIHAQINLVPGLSGAEVARVRFKDSKGYNANLFVKLLDWRDADDEMARYDRYVANRLGASSFAPAVTPMRTGLRKSGVIFSTLAAFDVSCIFDLLRADLPPASAGDIVRALRDAVGPWLENPAESVDTVRALRSQQTTDERLAERNIVLEPVMVSAEAVTVKFTSLIQHGDMHGKNVLVSDARHPVLIDFGDVGIGSSALDPMTLELSVLYHREGPARKLEWPTLGQLERWSDLEYYLEGCPYPDFVTACREWTMAVATEKAVAATLYAHSIRQLKYDDVDPELPLAAARGAARSLLSL